MKTLIVLGILSAVVATATPISADTDTGGVTVSVKVLSSIGIDSTGGFVSDRNAQAITSTLLYNGELYIITTIG